MIIRKALREDIDEIIGVATSTVDQSYRSWLGDAVVNRYLETDKLSNYLNTHLTETWLILKNSKVIGFAICIENMIDYILIEASHQSKGVGTSLLAYCEDLLFMNYSTVSIESFEKNLASTKFFTSKGWLYINKYLDAKSQSTKLIFKKNIHDTIQSVNILSA